MQMMCVSSVVKLNTSFVCVRVVAFLFPLCDFCVSVTVYFHAEEFEWNDTWDSPSVSRGFPQCVGAETLTSGCERVTAC